MANNEYLKLRNIQQLSDLRMFKGFEKWGNFLDSEHFDDYMDLLNELMCKVGDCANFAMMARQMAVCAGVPDSEIKILRNLEEEVKTKLMGLFIDLDHKINQLAQAKRYGK